MRERGERDAIHAVVEACEQLIAVLEDEAGARLVEALEDEAVGEGVPLRDARRRIALIRDLRQLAASGRRMVG